MEDILNEACEEAGTGYASFSSYEKKNGRAWFRLLRVMILKCKCNSLQFALRLNSDGELMQFAGGRALRGPFPDCSPAFHEISISGQNRDYKSKKWPRLQNAKNRDYNKNASIMIDIGPCQWQQFQISPIHDMEALACAFQV
jgi:hypothetical protein